MIPTKKTLQKKYGDAAGKIYKYGTKIADDVSAKKILGKEIVPVRKVINAVEKTNEWYQNSGANSVGEFVVRVSDRLKNIEVGSREWFAEKHEEIEKQTSVYMKEGLSEQTARWKATKELIERSLK